MKHSNKDRLADFIEAVWSQGDVDAADRFLAQAYTIHHDPGDPWDGQILDMEGFKDRVRRSRAPFPDQRFNINEMVEEGNKVVASWFWSGTHKGDIPGIPATDKAITMSGITIYTFDGDKISGHWQMTDRAGVYRQLVG
ncbi:MAG: ester cyclase [Pseudomonadota bacterium]